MRVLFDQGTPHPLRQSLRHHDTSTAYELGWARLKNGDLLDVAEKHCFEVIVTTDLQLVHQQNLRARRIAVVVLSTPSWLRIRRAIAEVVAAVDAATPASYKEVAIPR